MYQVYFYCGGGCKLKLRFAMIFDGTSKSNAIVAQYKGVILTLLFWFVSRNENSIPEGVDVAGLFYVVYYLIKNIFSWSTHLTAQINKEKCGALLVECSVGL